MKTNKPIIVTKKNVNMTNISTKIYKGKPFLIVKERVN
jgi:hypothetical protein